MQLKKVTEITAETTDGKKMEVGKTYIFGLGGKELAGTYQGLGFRQMLTFTNVLEGQFKDTPFHITPKSVSYIYEAMIEVKK